MLELFVPCPLEMVPELLLHVNVTPDCGGQLYETNELHNPLVAPFIDAGMGGVPTTIVLTRAAVTAPQILVAVTEIFPLVKPALNVTLMLLLVEKPEAFSGKDHEYDDTPGTDGTLYVYVIPAHTEKVPLITPIAGEVLVSVNDFEGDV